MAWTTVSTQVTGTTVTAALWNELVNNNLHIEEIAYAERTSDLAVSNTSAATAHTVVSAGAATYEAGDYWVTVSACQAQVGAAGNALLTFDLWDDSTQLGMIGVVDNNAAAVMGVPYERTTRVTLTAASHTLIWKAWRTNADGIVFAGDGTTANDHAAAYIRVRAVIE